MSLINDALKQARQSQQPNPPSGQPPLRPVESHPRATNWFLTLAVVVLAAAAGFFIWLALAGQKTPPAKALQSPAAPTAAAAPIVARPTNAPPVSNAIAPAAAALPRLQGVVYGQKSWAIVDGKTVYAGDSVGNFHVKEIFQSGIVLQDTNGVELKLGIGE